MIRVFVERSGESPALATAEVVAGAEALGGRAPRDGAPSGPNSLVIVDLPDREAARALASRLALARRCLVSLSPGHEVEADLEAAGRSGTTAAVRRLGSPSGGSQDAALLAAGAAFRRGGGMIDLEHPERRFWLVRDADGRDSVLEEVAPVDRAAVDGRRMPRLPFQRPVSLPPRLARAAANLARIRPGDRVLDPFVGTGALLAEAALLGARAVGLDREAGMVKGALRNFAHLGVTAEELAIGDAGEIDAVERGEFDAMLSDPPYGRASGTGGEEARRVVERIVPRWAARIRPRGRIVLVLPGGYDPVPSPWRPILEVPVRVHRSLTREFRVYERPAD